MESPAEPPAMPDPTPSGASDQTQSVARAVALLRCFADADSSLTLSELARRTDMNPSTALRLLRTLCAGGVLYRAEDSERYELGPLVEQLAHRVYAGHARDDVRKAVEALASTLHEAASFGRRDHNVVVIEIQTASDQALRFDRPAGVRVPLHMSAMGKTMMAFSDASIADEVRALGTLEPRTPNTITSAKKLEAQLREVHERGWALVDEEQHLGVRSVAAPVLDDAGHAVAGVAVQGPVSRLTDDRLDAVAAAVQDTARIIGMLRVLPDFDTP